jgi:DNA-binding transcriptional ArsR family regulator
VRPEGLPAGVIAERLGVQPSSPSFHLSQLVHADLITQRCLSRQLIYSASGSGVSMTALGHGLPSGGAQRVSVVLSAPDIAALL